MLGVEAAKILMARFQDLMKEVEVYVLTFDFADLDYELLNAELESKWFQGQDKSMIKIIHWSNFLAKFAQDHEDVLAQEQKLLLKKETKKYKISKSGGFLL